MSKKIYTVSIIGCGSRGAMAYGTVIAKQKERFSIVYTDLTKCCHCGSNLAVAKNEVYEGAYRQRSMKMGMIAPFCIKCHDRFHNDIMFNLHYKVLFEKEFLKTHTQDEFIKMFGQDYIFKLEQKKSRV